ncbi:MAG TPA: transcriptional repressor LexA [Trebonia sp.]|jgi:repressor LexA|nr:transcriptional repressor LexA [Trebonia sp.]
MIPEMPEQPDPDHVLTWRQRKILQVIRDGVRTRGYPPSMVEIAAAVGLKSMASVSYQVAKLERKGYLHRDGRRPRTMEVRLPGQPPVRSGQNSDSGTDKPNHPRDIPGREPVYVPFIGRIAADRPLLAKEQVKEVFPLPRKLVGEGTLFLLRMAGDSMINAAIADADLVVVRQQAIACDGDIVAVTLAGEVTVRSFRRGDDHDWLVPHHPDYIPVLGDNATILGKVVAVLRQV